MRKKMAGALLALGICVTSVSAVAAQCRDVSEQIVETETQIKIWEHEQNQSMAEILKADIISLEEQIDKAEQNRKAAEEAGDSLEALRMELTLSNYRKEVQEKKESLAAYQLQADLDAYYVLNQDKLTEDQKARNQYECYGSRITIAKYEARQSYLEAQKIELEKKTEAEEKKLELGYATEAEAESVRSALQKTHLAMQEAEEEIAFQKEVLSLYGETMQDGEQPAIPQTLEELSGDYTSAFYENSAQIKFYEQQIAAYCNYIDNAAETDETLEKIRLQLELARLKKEQYRMELEKYVKQNEKSYRQSKLRMEEYDCEIEALEQKIKNSELLYEKGRLRQIDVLELKTEKAQLEYERQSCVCDALINRYILEHTIEGT